MADEISKSNDMPDTLGSNTNGKGKRMSRLTCTQCEGMLLDASDGLLLPDEQSHFDLHLAECSACTRLFADVRRGVAWMELLKEAPPVPPAGLVDRILAKTSGDPELSGSVLAQAAHAASLFGHSQAKVLPFRVPAHLQQPRTAVQRMMHTVMQPRFMMTAAMAFFSIALTMNIAGIRLSALRASDLKPNNVKKSFWAANGRVVRYYDNLRVVYELESRVHEMQRDSDTEPAPQRGVVSTPQNDTQPPRQAPSGSPHSSAPRMNRDAPATPSQSRDNKPHLLQVDRNLENATVLKMSQEGVRA
jgi:hypothetical protein